MNSIQLLDCTLREAPVDNFYIGDSLMREFISRCEDVRINIIECGFLKDVDHISGSNCFRTVEEIREYIPNKKPGIMYVALMDYGRYNINNLSDYDGRSIDGIRICFKKDQQRDAIAFAKEVKAKGYKVFIQHVDTLGYSDVEIIQFIDEVNKLHPFSYAIVDTFGSMYEEDLDRLTMLINYHLNSDIILGFHAHNNLMLANSNAQNFIARFAGKRKIVVDASALGCGRGAGNAHTELLIEFLNKKYHYSYDLNQMLDLIDHVMPRFREKCEWGYGIPFFLSGMHSAHVYNVNQLMRRHNIASKDLRAIIEKLDSKQKKNYDYALLEKLYVEYFNHPVDDREARKKLKEKFMGKKVLLLALGKTLYSEKKKVQDFIEKERPVVIGINSRIKGFNLDYIFFSCGNRYNRYLREVCEYEPELIVTSNINLVSTKNIGNIVDYNSLIKFGWINIDSSMILLLRLMASVGCTEIYIAGFDGFTKNKTENYYDADLVTDMNKEDLILLTKENQEMLVDLCKEHPDMHLHFITTSQYEAAILGGDI